MPTYEQLLRFYVEQTRRPVQTDPPVLSYEDLHEYYLTFFERPAAPLPPSSEDAMVVTDELVTKDEAREAFGSVQETLASVGDEQAQMKTGLQGLASKIDEVQGKAAEDLTALAHKAGAAWSQASSVASDLSARLTDAERQQAAAKAAADRAQAASDAALMESAQARRDQQIARAQFEADLQAATLQSQAAADRAAFQAAQASADARSANVEVPRLDATLLQLQSELRAMRVASQQAQERALRLESELSAAQDRIGAAERKAAHAEKRHSALQKRMDDWDAFRSRFTCCFERFTHPSRCR